MDAVRSGKFIKQCRTEKGLTQKQLADMLSCTDKAISRWETGKGFPEISLLIPLSESLEISVNEIILGERIEKEMLVKKSDEIIVHTIDESNKKMKRSHRIIFILFVLIEALIFFYSSFAAQPGDEMAVVVFNCIAVPVCSFLLGLTNISFRLKLLYSPITVAMFIPSALLFFHYDIMNTIYDYVLPYSAIFAISSAILIIVGSGITNLILLIIRHIKSHNP